MQENEELRSETDVSAEDASQVSAEEAMTPPETQEETLPEEPAVSVGNASVKRVKSLFDYVETFCIALSVLIVIFLFVCRYVSVEGNSMYPTLHGDASSHAEQGLAHMDRLIISNLFYTPKTGDIVVINDETRSKPLIKRVIAVEGQTVRIDFNTWEVWVDNTKLKEDYTNYIDGIPMGEQHMNSLYGVTDGVCEFTVEEGKVFVMGDNRTQSMDSRTLGSLDSDRILGKVIVRLFPLSEFGSVS